MAVKRLMTMRVILALAVAAIFGISTADAQTERTYVGATGMLSAQGSHRQGTAPSLPTTGAEGTAIGVAAEAGALLTPRVALGFEVSFPRRFRAVQEIDHLRVFQYESRHRDTATSGLFLAIALSAHGIQLGIVGGGGYVQENTRQRRRDQTGPLPTFPPVFGPYSKEYSFTRWTAAALVGAHVEVAISSRTAIVPQVRVHFIGRSEDPSEPGWALGLSSMVLRAALVYARCSDVIERASSSSDVHVRAHTGEVALAAEVTWLRRGSKEDSQQTVRLETFVRE